MENHPIIAFAVLDKNHFVVTDQSILKEVNCEKIISSHIQLDYMNFSIESYDEKKFDLIADYIHHMYIVHLNKETQSNKELPNTLRLDYPYLQEQWYYETLESNESYDLIRYSFYLYDK